jgi:hypothetical protein
MKAGAIRGNPVKGGCRRRWRLDQRGGNRWHIDHVIPHIGGGTVFRDEGKEHGGRKAVSVRRTPSGTFTARNS